MPNPPLQLEPLDLDPVGLEQAPVSGKLDLEPLDLEPVGESELAPVQKRLEEEQKRSSFLDHPVFETKPVTDEEIRAIADKYQIDPETLKTVAPFFSAQTVPKSFGESLKSGAVGTAGFVGEAAFGIPQFLAKKAASPAYERAIDELRNIGKGRQSYSDIASEVAAVPTRVAAKAATLGKGALRTIGEAAGLGALGGVAQSKQGEEVEAGLFGAGIGGTLGGLVHMIPRKTGDALSEAEVKYTASNTAKIAQDAEELATKRSDSESIIRNRILNLETAKLSAEQAERVARDFIPEEKLQKLMSAETQEGRMVRKQVADRLELPDEALEHLPEGEIYKQIAEGRVVYPRARQLASELGGSVPRDVEIAKASILQKSKLGPEAIGERYEALRKSFDQLDVIRSKGIHDINSPGLPFTTFSDAQFVLGHAGEKLGVDANKILNKTTSNHNRMLETLGNMKDRVYKIFKTVPETVDRDLINDQGGAIYNAIRTGELGTLVPEEQKAAQDIVSYFHNGLDFVNRGISEVHPEVRTAAIPVRRNYVPEMVKDYKEFMRSMETAKRQALKEAGVESLEQLSNGQITELRNSSEAMRDFISGLEFANSRKLPNRTADVVKRYRELFSTNGRTTLNTIATAAQEREGKIPEFLKEKNVYKLMTRWANNTMRHLYMHQPLAEMRQMADVLGKGGAEVESKYVKELIGDYLGTREGTLGKYSKDLGTKFDLALSQMIENTSNSLSRGTLKAFRATPEVINSAVQSVYPNLLGLSPRAIMNNITQPFLKTAPELGGTYGPTTVFKSYISTFLNRKALLARLNKWGLDAPSPKSAHYAALSEGLSRSPAVRKLKGSLQAATQATMSAYQTSDRLNRMITLGVADHMISDMARGSKEALHSLSKMPHDIQRTVLDTLRSGDKQTANATLAKYLIERTQYNYNRLTMSKLGRSVGPLFAQFSKWPAATAGEIVQELKDKGLLKGSERLLEKFAYPAAGLAAVGYLIHGSPEEMSDRQKMVFGSKGLLTAAPINSLYDPIAGRGEIFSPPLVSTIGGGIVRNALKGDPEATAKGLAQAINIFTPGSVYARFLLDDMQTYVSGQKPDKTYTERVLGVGN